MSRFCRTCRSRTTTSPASGEVSNRRFVFMPGSRHPSFIRKQRTDMSLKAPCTRRRNGRTRTISTNAFRSAWPGGMPMWTSACRPNARPKQRIGRHSARMARSSGKGNAMRSRAVGCRNFSAGWSTCILSRILPNRSGRTSIEYAHDATGAAGPLAN